MCAIGRHGFTENSKLPDGGYCLRLPVNPDDHVLAQLIEISAEMVHPQIETTYDKQGKQVVLYFPQSLEKPPVRAMRDSLDKLKSYIFNQCITKDPDSAGYFVSNPGKLPIHPLAFAKSFLTLEETAEPYYRLPNEEVFVTQGRRYNGGALLDKITFQRYLEQNEPEYLPAFGAGKIPPAAILVEPQVMQRMLDGMGVVPKGAYRN